MDQEEKDKIARIVADYDFFTVYSLRDHLRMVKNTERYLGFTELGRERIDCTVIEMNNYLNKAHDKREDTKRVD